MSPSTDPVLTAIARLEAKMDDLTQRVRDHESRLRWVSAAVIMAVGIVGGPNAVALITGGSA